MALVKLKEFVKKTIRHPKYSGKYPQSWPYLQTDLRKYAEETGVVSDIHEADYLLHFLLNHQGWDSYSDAVKYYFQDGQKSAKKLSKLLSELEIKRDHETSFLEFASGYGMVTRHLTKQIHPMKIVSCDIHQQAIDFLSTTIGVEAVLSQSTPEALNFREPFDVVFALSFFSHMPDKTFGRWLQTLYRAVKPQGYLIFTTHGHTSAGQQNVQIPESGILFASASEQQDLSEQEYGTCFVSPEYVCQTIKKHLQGHIKLQIEKFWWEHQDLYVIGKEKDEGYC